MPRTPPHFKVRCTVANHAKMAAVYADNDLMALWVRLGLKAVERFADRTAGTFIVHDRELVSLTGKGRADVARTLLERLADVSPISASRDGDIWRITIPNFAEKQGFRPKNGYEMAASASATSSSSSSSSSSSPTSSQLPPSCSSSKGGRASRAGPGRLVEGGSPEPEPDEPMAVRRERLRLMLDPDGEPREPGAFDAALRSLPQRDLERLAIQARGAWVDGVARDVFAYFVGLTGAQRAQRAAAGG